MRALRVALLLVVAGCALPPPDERAMRRPDATTRESLQVARSALQAALAQGDRQALERLLDADFVFVHSTGKLETRLDFIERMVASRASGTAPAVDFLDDDIRLYGDVAIWITRSVRRGTALSFVGTDVLVRRRSGWTWTSVQSTRTDRSAPAP